MDNYSDLNWQEAAVRGLSKREIYRLMTMKSKYYFPPEFQVTSEFFYDIMVGNKRVSILVIHLALGVEAERVVMMHAPQIPGLKVIQILEESKRYTDIDADMPNLKDSKFHQQGHCCQCW